LVILFLGRPERRRTALQVKHLGDSYLISLETGEEIINSLEQFADGYRVGFGTILAIGTLERVTLGQYDPKTQRYRHKKVEEPVELVNVTGNIAKGQDGEPIVYAQATVALSNCSALGGHLVEAVVGLNVEITIETASKTIRRRHDPDTGLDLWDLGAVETLSA
jgi:hypothetical protein